MSQKERDRGKQKLWRPNDAGLLSMFVYILCFDFTVFNTLSRFTQVSRSFTVIKRETEYKQEFKF